jgi:hypothetical protein
LKTIIEILQAQLLFGAFAALVLGYITDFVWVRWMQKVGENKRFPAGVYSVFVGMIALVYTNIYVSNNWLFVVCYWVGCFVGSYKAVKK